LSNSLVVTQASVLVEISKYSNVQDDNWYTML